MRFIDCESVCLPNWERVACPEAAPAGKGHRAHGTHSSKASGIRHMALGLDLTFFLCSCLVLPSGCCSSDFVSGQRWSNAMLVTNKLQYQPTESAQVECARLPDTLRATHTHRYELSSAHVLQKVSVYFLPFTLHRSAYSIFLVFFSSIFCTHSISISTLI